jgi:signal transduction histidine kinase/ligand-binding sensor domain-containing protein
LALRLAAWQFYLNEKAPVSPYHLNPRWMSCVCVAVWLVYAGWTTAQAQYRFGHWTANKGLPQNPVRVVRQTPAGYLFVFSLWLMTLCTGLVCAQTLSSRKVLGRYQQFVWQDQHGLPQNGVNAVVRTRDGYLWVGTFEGAARFDGVRFTIFDNSNTPALRVSHQILAMLEDRAGNLWLGTNGGGLIRYRDEQFQVYDTTNGLANNHIRSLLEDRAGNLWIATDGGLSCWREGRFTNFHRPDGLPNEQTWALAEDATGAIWVGTDNGLARVADGRLTVYPAPQNSPWSAIHALLVDHTGMLWVGSFGNGLYQYRAGKFQPCFPALASAFIRTLYQDRAGNVWAGTRGQGLALLQGDRCTFYSRSDGLPSDSIVAIQEDSEGDLWLGSVDEGLVRLRPGRFQVYTIQDGLPYDWALATFADRVGRVWLGTYSGLSVWQQGVIKALTRNDGLPVGTVTSLTEDAAGTIWLNASRKAFQYRDGRFLPAPLYQGQAIENVRVVLGDRAGNVWIGTHGSGLYRYRDGKYSLYTTRDGLVSNKVWVFYEDRAGGIWIGTYDGLSYWRDGQFRSWTVKDGLSSNQTISFYEDRAGNMWIGTNGGGLNRWRDGKFVSVTVNDGLYDNLAFQLLCDTEDDSGNLWMSSNRGIYRVSLPELNEFAERRRRKVTSYVYGVSDGMLSRECNGASPAGCKTPDGKLWFPTMRGAVVIDPHLRALQPPRVAIENAIVDRQPVSTRQTIQLSPEQENLEIRYTALSWGRPDQVRFKYQMTGLDHEWIEVGTRRTAYYSHLPPGSYEFRVIADNGEGVWDNEGQRLRIVVQPPFYRTWWFLSLSALAVAGAIFASVRYRVRQVEAREAAQQAFAQQLIESQEAERKRIAAELHDSLGQNLLVIKNWAMIGLNTPNDVMASHEPLTEISTTASQAIDDVRQVVYDLRPYQLDKIGLTNTLRFMIEKVGTAAGLEIQTEFGAIDELFSHNEQVTLFRIVQECVNNIVKHAQATVARVAITPHDKTVRVVIEDNGRGFAVAQRQGSGFGLQGLHERARILKGEVTIHSAPGHGTKIQITIDRKQ